MNLAEVIKIYKRILAVIIDTDGTDTNEKEFFEELLKCYTEDYKNPYLLSSHEIFSFHEDSSFEDLVNTIVFENLSLSFTQAIVRVLEAAGANVTSCKTKVSGKTIYVPYCDNHIILPWGPIRVGELKLGLYVSLTKNLCFEIITEYESSKELPLDDFNSYLGVDVVCSVLNTLKLKKHLDVFIDQVEPYVEDRETEKVLH